LHTAASQSRGGAAISKSNDQCHGLRELALSFHLLSDELLLALSSEKPIHLEHLRIADTLSHHSKEPAGRLWSDTHPRSTSSCIFSLYKEFEPFFRKETPVTYLYFGRAVTKEMLGRIGLNCPWPSAPA
ncbi:F-box/LRR-repeat protein 3, partial [Perca fluviatilis]|uniref:F-box/LRR-repeat protein 3 n=1 Tax=Perca fluviatilis TaxID=8168 RepID=UPI0019646FFA